MKYKFEVSERDGRVVLTYTGDDTWQMNLPPNQAREIAQILCEQSIRAKKGVLRDTKIQWARLVIESAGKYVFVTSHGFTVGLTPKQARKLSRDLLLVAFILLDRKADRMKDAPL